MLFNSFQFLLGYLPIALIVLFGVVRFGNGVAVSWLLLMSLAFYAGWTIDYLPLLLASITVNFAAGSRIAAAAATGRARRAGWLLAAAVVLNLAVLGYFKYAAFLVEAVNTLGGVGLAVPQVELPLGISFFTFTQIAFLVDARRGQTAVLNPLSYGLFVTYYPHLVAGPILHHREMMSQFGQPGAFRFSGGFLAAGLALFAIGLAKKVIIADSLAPTADAIFIAADHLALNIAEAWVGALAYTLQIYFDFSGYSDMALGLSLMMGVRLPLNFNSPYKSVNIVEFWRRWHMTLSRFLRDYLYIPLGGNRHGPLRRYANLLATMLLGGLWHGAGWTFVIWGGLHGAYLVVNHAWQAAPRGLRMLLPRPMAWGLTLLSVIVAWVFFRADSLAQAKLMLTAMAGGNGLALPGPLATVLAPLLGPSVQAGGTFGHGLFDPVLALPVIAAAAAIALFLPNSQELMARCSPALVDRPIPASRVAWSANWRWGVVIGALAGVAITMIGGASPFLYFRF